MGLASLSFSMNLGIAQVGTADHGAATDETIGLLWLHGLENFFLALAHIGEVILEGVAIVCVLIGIVVTVRLGLKLIGKRRRNFPFIQIRLQFGIWLALALEFQLGADVLNTTIAPSTDALVRLAVIAVIRTFLNYFLNQEIEAQIELREKAVEHHQHDLLTTDQSHDETNH